MLNLVKLSNIFQFFLQKRTLLVILQISLPRSNHLSATNWEMSSSLSVNEDNLLTWGMSSFLLEIEDDILQSPSFSSFSLPLQPLSLLGERVTGPCKVRISPRKNYSQFFSTPNNLEGPLIKLFDLYTDLLIDTLDPSWSAVWPWLV